MDVQAKYKKCMNYLKGNKKYLTIKIENKNNFFFYEILCFKNNHFA